MALALILVGLLVVFVVGRAWPDLVYRYSLPVIRFADDLPHPTWIPNEREVDQILDAGGAGGWEVTELGGGFFAVTRSALVRFSFFRSLVSVEPDRNRLSVTVVLPPTTLLVLLVAAGVVVAQGGETSYPLLLPAWMLGRELFDAYSVLKTLENGWRRDLAETLYPGPEVV